jgi:tyrosinase
MEACSHGDRTLNPVFWIGHWGNEMASRRRFILGAAVAVMAPYITRRTARAATPIVRRDVMKMSDKDAFFSDYAKAVQKMHELTGDNRSWIGQAKIHADHCHHGDLEFLHWHRHYIRFFEKICAKLSDNPDFALAYWNWSENSGRIPAPFFDRPELNVEHWNDPGKYVGKVWGPIDTVGRRGLDKTHGLIDDPIRGGAFTLETVNGIKGLPSMDLFRPALEGQPHNNAHVVAGATKSGKTGHIGDGLSPLDPIFWLHHCMVDRVWAEWQKSPGHTTPDPKTTYPGQFFDGDGKPVTATSAEAMDTANLGYTYDIFEAGPAGLTNTVLSNEQLNQLSKLTAAGAPQPIGSTTNTSASRANIETAIDISVPTLQNRVAQLQALKATGLITTGRVLAKLSDLTSPEFNDLLVNVFVDCPYLASTTPYTDPHYAGTFSFFGRPKMMPGMDSLTYVIDITKPVREAGFSPDKLRLQFMPVSAAAGIESKSIFKVGRIDILAF